MYKKVPYFQNLNTKETPAELVSNFTPLTVQPQDILAINVTSLNPEASAIFNTNLSRLNGNNFDINPNNPITGYLVDPQGSIQLPFIGAVKVSGSTTEEIRKNIQQSLKAYVKEPTVTVRILNFKISVLGDVANPGVYQIANERVTLTDVLSMAGDLNITAVRTNLLLVREVDGERKYTTIDLTSKELFTSSYFYLKNNDLIYVQADRTKYAQVDRGYRVVTLLLSGLSIIAIVLSNLYR
jgi:polysaccharide export outer membrane protein